MMFLERGGFAIVAVLSCLALFWQLDSGSLRDWDEAIYAQVAKEMAESGDWLTPHYEYRPFYEKPPLRFWLTATELRLLSIYHSAAATGRTKASSNPRHARQG